MTADLVISGGSVVTSRGQQRLDVAISGGRVDRIGPPGLLEARRFVDAGGLVLLPGGVDSHVHLMDPGSTDREDFPSGTRAAACAGTTTIIEHSHGHPVRTVSDLEAKLDHLGGRSNVDFALAAHAWPGDESAKVRLWQAGIAFFKVFTCTTHGVPGHDVAALRRHLVTTADIGAVSLIHCEDESLTTSAESVLRAADRYDPGLVLEWRDRDAEVVAATVTALLVRRTGAKACIAHVSHAEVAEYLSAERARGAGLFAETCPQYLLLRENDIHEHGPFRKFTPPARNRTAADESEQWQQLRDGRITHVSSDHAPSTAEQKTSGDIWDVHFGLPGLDTTMPLLLDAVVRGRLAYEDIARLYAEVPARLYGLWPRKGSIAPGFDADIVFFDPSSTRTVRNEDVLSKAGWTPFDGRTVRGRVVRTLLRGEVVSDDGVPVDARSGEFISGAGRC